MTAVPRMGAEDFKTGCENIVMVQSGNRRIIGVAFVVMIDCSALREMEIFVVLFRVVVVGRNVKIGAKR